MLSLPLPKVKALRFLERMFKDRGYKNLKITRHTTNIHVYADKPNHERVLAVLKECTPMGGIADWPFPIPEDEIVSQYKSKHKSGVGMDFVKDLVQLARDHEIPTVMIVTDFLTSHAIKFIGTVKKIHVSFFAYQEVCIENMAEHIYQPITFRALQSEEKKNYIMKHPKFATELPRYASNDALVKYYGLKSGDIVYIEDNDRQTGLVKEYGIIVEKL